jgi:anti-anti-sigma factor
MRFHTDRDLAVFALSGRLTSLDGVEPLRRRFREAVSEGHRHFLFDLRQALFMDSSSIGEMCACLKRAAEVSGSVQLLVKQDSIIDETIRLAALHQVFRIHYDETELGL